MSFEDKCEKTIMKVIESDSVLVGCGVAFVFAFLFLFGILKLAIDAVLCFILSVLSFVAGCLLLIAAPFIGIFKLGCKVFK